MTSRGKIRVVQARPAYECRSQCGLGEGAPDVAYHRGRNWCTLPDHGPALWDATCHQYSVRLGDFNGADFVTEDLSKCGCPKGYMVSPFADSVRQFARYNTRSNRHYDTCDDWLIIDAVHALEHHIDGHRAIFDRARDLG